MMKYGLIGLMIITVCVSCNNGMSGAGRGMSESGAAERRDRSRRTVIDSAQYVDFTGEKYNALQYRKEDLLAECYGRYRLAGGNSYITFDRGEGSITLSSDSAHAEGTRNNQFYAKYRFEVAGASRDCLYIRPGKKDNAKALLNQRQYEGAAVPDLMVCLPLYGFSRNRIEVSPVMDGYSAMPSGTYWKEN